MKKYLEQLEENCREHGGFIALKSKARIKGLTYSQLWEYSGRVYAYMKKHGIGKENMLLICMPRGIRTIVAAIGVWRAGAAFTIVESNYARERIEYIRADCGCVLTVDEAVYAEMMRETALDGYAPSAPHDAAFAVYTSGSTGNPKGVLHEYGKLEQVAVGYGRLYSDLPDNAVFAYFSPLNFVACISCFIESTYYARCFYIVPYDVTKDIGKLSADIRSNGVSYMFASPSLLRTFCGFPSSLKKVLLASEPCNGMFAENPRLINMYSSSEIVFPVTAFEIDRKYDITPIGKQTTDADIMIMDEQGNRLPDGQTGEICVLNEYTRGYINLPEKTAEAFVDHVFHTSDLGHINEDGLLVIHGRKDDMIKINGNRIEPVEIEAAVRKVLGVDKAVAKGFADEKRSYICVYLLRNELKSLRLLNANGNLRLSPAEMTERLSDCLPYYMIPSYYVVLEEYPKNKNGKIAKKELKAPEIDAFREEYEAPWNLVEAHFCELFGKVLNVEKVSVHDDFYLLGGDSLSTMELVSECRYKGISTADIYKYRTPRKISDYYIDNYGLVNVDADQMNAKALTQLQPLPPELQEVLECQELVPDSVMWNLPLMFRLKPGIDPERLANAIDRVLRSHPVYSTVIAHDKYSTPMLKYAPELFKNTRVFRTRQISEEDFLELKDALVRPFDLSGGLFYRRMIYLTETNCYLFFDHYHLISDGTSLRLLFEQISRCYRDETYTPPNDYYYYMIREEEKARLRGDGDELGQYYKDFYQKYFVSHDTPIEVRYDREPSSFNSRAKSNTLLKRIGSAKSVIVEHLGELTENVFFLAACLLTIAQYNRSDSAFLHWVTNGRDTKEKNDMTGLLYRCMPLGSILSPELTVQKFYDEILAQVRYTVTHTLYRSCDFMGYEVKSSLYFLFQKNIFNGQSFDLAEQSIPHESEDKYAESNIEMMVFDDDTDVYPVSIEYDTERYDRDSMEKFFAIYDKTVEALTKIDDPGKVRLSCILDY